MKYNTEKCNLDQEKNTSAIISEVPSFESSDISTYPILTSRTKKSK